MENPDVYVFEDKVHPGDWRVEAFSADGEGEMAIFSGPRARARAVAFAKSEYGFTVPRQHSKSNTKKPPAG